MKRLRALVSGVLVSWATAAVALPADPEGLLIEVLKALQAGHIDAARARAQALSEQFPNYPMGKVLSVELNARLAGDEVVLKKLHAWHRDTVGQTLAEAAVRWRHAQQAVAPQQWVHSLILSPGAQRWWVVVDLSASRLYLFENRSGQLEPVLDTYVSIGAGGVGKQRKGDHRTPVGVYRIRAWRDGADLPPIYGDGALVLDYPNLWDRFVGRTGSGIWLHGTPPNLYARPPASSKGCVVLSNQALDALRKHVRQPAGIPVVLVDSIAHLPALDPQALAALAQQLARVQATTDVEMVRYPGEPDLIYVAWRGHGGVHAQFWRTDPVAGATLALEQVTPLARGVRLAEKQAQQQVR